MQAIIKGNAALCTHTEKVQYRIKGKCITTTHLFGGFLLLQGSAAGISGYLFDN